MGTVIKQHQAPAKKHRSILAFLLSYDLNPVFENIVERPVRHYFNHINGQHPKSVIKVEKFAVGGAEYANKVCKPICSRLLCHPLLLQGFQLLGNVFITLDISIISSEVLILILDGGCVLLDQLLYEFGNDLKLLCQCRLVLIDVGGVGE